jgi:hypothetical protein
MEQVCIADACGSTMLPCRVVSVTDSRMVIRAPVGYGMAVGQNWDVHAEAVSPRRGLIASIELREHVAVVEMDFQPIGR